MKRRAFIAGLGGAAAWTVAARGQRSTTPVIGFLGVSSFENMGGGVLLDFKRGLAEIGYVEGNNVAIEYRWADEHYDRLAALALDLVQHKVAVMAAPGSPAERTGCDEADRGMKLDRSRKRTIKSLVLNQSVSINGHNTSVSIEGAFWNALKEIAVAQNISASALVSKDRQ